MTNEKVIEVLTNHRRFIFEDSEEDIAIVMAISALEKQTNTAEILNKIDILINATDMNDDYSVGLRNGMRLVKSLLDNKEPKFEKIKQTNTAECEHDYECDKCNDYACEQTNTAESPCKTCPQDCDTTYECEVYDKWLMGEKTNTAEWIKEDGKGIIFDVGRCSNCGNFGSNKFKYCPNCGSKMKGE